MGIMSAPQVPFKLTPEDMGVGNPAKAMGQGASVVDTMIGTYMKNLQAQELKAKLPYIADEEAAKLQNAQLTNEWMPKLNASTIGYQGAQAGKLNKETEWYDQEAQSKIAFNAAQAQQMQQNANLNKQLIEQMQHPAQTGQPTSSYGIEVPAPTPEQIAQKRIYGIDTYDPLVKQRMAQQQAQLDMFNKQREHDKEVYESSRGFQTQLGQYNALMDQASTLTAGRLGGNLPFSLSATSNDLDTVINNMGKTGVEQMRDAMDSARFSNLDMNLAQKLKPAKNWSDETRKLYTDFSQAAHARLGEKNEFYDFIANHPEAGFNKQNADAAWKSYQDTYPISDGGKVIKRENLGHYEQFYTPEALEAIKKTGKYDPEKMRKDREAKENEKSGKSAPIKVTFDASGTNLTMGGSQ